MFFLLNQLVQNILYPCEWIDLFSHMRELYPISMCVIYFLYPCLWIFHDISPRVNHILYLYPKSMHVYYISYPCAWIIYPVILRVLSQRRPDSYGLLFETGWGGGGLPVVFTSVSVHGGNNVTGDFVCGGLIIATQWTLYWAFIGSLWRLK